MSQEDRQSGMTHSLKIPGVAIGNAEFKKLLHWIVLAVVAIPSAAVIIAVISIYYRGIGLTEVGLLVSMYTATTIGIVVGYHRYFGHQSFKTNKITRALLAILGSMALQGPVLSWVAIHRRHHAFSDLAGDPHSPYLHSNGEYISNSLLRFWHGHIGWMFTPEITDCRRYAPDLVKDKMIFKINRYYLLWVVLGMLIPAILGGILTKTWTGVFYGFLWGGLVRISLVHHSTWTIGSICHVYGKRPYKIKDESANNGWLALMTFGDSWHNNHHAFPAVASHGHEWWQIDLAGLLIKVLEKTGLAWDVITINRNTAKTENNSVCKHLR